MHVGIFTYQTGHLKTYQMIQKLLVKSYKISIFAFPFVLRQPKIRKFEERPYQIIPIDLSSYCDSLGIDYYEMPGWERSSSEFINKLENKPDIYLTVIAKIIPEHFIVNNKILNCHPGLLPDNRGLDAFKWSILRKEPIGISLHIINKHIDAGVVLKTVRIPVLKSDSYETVCERAYSMECDLQASFADYMENDREENIVDLSVPLSTEKIPEAEDRIFDKRFSEYKSVMCEF